MGKDRSRFCLLSLSINFSHGTGKASWGMCFCLQSGQKKAYDNRNFRSLDDPGQKTNMSLEKIWGRVGCLQQDEKSVVRFRDLKRFSGISYLNVQNGQFLICNN